MAKKNTKLKNAEEELEVEIVTENIQTEVIDNEEIYNKLSCEDEIIFSLAKAEKELDDIVDVKLFNLFKNILDEYNIKKKEVMSILADYNEIHSNEKDFKKQMFRIEMGVSKFHLGKRKMILNSIEQLSNKLGAK